MWKGRCRTKVYPLVLQYNNPIQIGWIRQASRQRFLPPDLLSYLMKKYWWLNSYFLSFRRSEEWSSYLCKLSARPQSRLFVQQWSLERSPNIILSLAKDVVNWKFETNVWLFQDFRFSFFFVFTQKTLVMLKSSETNGNIDSSLSFSEGLLRSNHFFKNLTCSAYNQSEKNFSSCF